MNNKGLIAILLCFIVMTAVGCGVFSSGGSTTSNTFFSNTANTTPVFKPSSSTSAVTTASSSEWGSGNPLYSVYFSLREFLSSRDEGRVDRSNLYKLLTDVDTVLSGLTGSASTIEAKEITPPFDLLTKITCNKVYNDTANKKAIAMNETSTQLNAIISWIWTDAAMKEEYGVASVQLNKSTKDIIVDMIYSVDYDITGPETTYNLRCYVTGNADRNEFQFKYIIGDCKIVAKGISRGEGNYMLFKYQQGTDPTKYIVVPGTAAESFFTSQNTTPTEIYTSEASLPSTVASYKDWVVSASFFTTAEVVSNINTFNQGNSKQGTIYINY